MASAYLFDVYTEMIMRRIDDMGGINIGGIKMGGIKMGGMKMGGIKLGGMKMGGIKTGSIKMGGTVIINTQYYCRVRNSTATTDAHCNEGK